MATVFDYFIITAPSEQIAESYRPQLRLLQHSLPSLRQAEVFCVADPQGVRLGSGGGTLHALQDVARQCGGAAKLQSGRVLLVHSGGDSRRAPLYSVCGKAWSSLNQTTEQGLVVNPIILLIQQLSELCKGLASGSLVVACSDVLLDLQLTRCFHFDLFREEGVYIATVAASATTAKNHGVLVNYALLAQLSNSEAVTSPCEQCAVDQYLQKPSVATMVDCGALFADSAVQSSPFATPQALIDTGVVVFTKDSFQTLFSLLDCEMSAGKSLGGNMVRFELYHELLCACATSSNLQENFAEFLIRIGVQAKSGSDYHYLLSKLWADFHRVSLRLVHVVQGSFHHLGTSQEVLQLIGDRNRDKSSQMNVNSCVLIDSPSRINSVTCVQSFLHLRTGTAGEPPVSPSSYSSQLTTLVEHSIISCSQFPRGSMLSHLYACFGEHLHIPDGFLLQQVFLEPLTNTVGGNLSLLLTLHINDDVKAGLTTGTIYGRPWVEFFAAFQCEEADLWPTPYTEKTLWTAKLFPVVHVDHHCRLSCFHQEEKVWVGLEVEDLLFGCDFHRKQGGVAPSAWRSVLRLSLSELLLHADSLAMFSWKQLLSSANAVFLDKASYKTWSSLDLVHMQWRKLVRRWCGPTRSMEALASALMTLQLREKFSDAVTEAEIGLKLFSDVGLAQLFSDLFGLSTSDVCDLVEDYVHLRAVLEKQGEDSFLELSKLLNHFFRNFAELNISDCKAIANYLLQLIGTLDDKNHPRLLLAVSWIFDHHPALRFSANQSFSSDENLTITNGSDIIVSKFQDALNGMVVGEVDGQQRVGDYFEMLTQRLVCLHIQWSLAQHHSTKENDLLTDCVNKDLLSRNRVLLAQAPVRIDLAGGWSDTPPICYDQAGAVLNVAIRVDNRHPIRCVSRFCEKPQLHFQCWKRFNEESAEIENDIALAGEEICVEFEELKHLSLTASPCALLKACLLALGFASEDKGLSLSGWLQDRFSGGIQIACFSDLPAGSGMGGSSILAAAILQSVAALLGKPLSNQSLIYLVSEVEQLLTTGGGWQDQIGGCFAAFKIARSASELPLVVDVEPVPTSPSFNNLFSHRTFLIYTGQQRLAKNTLINALRTFSVTTACCAEISKYSTVNQLRQNAETGRVVLKLLEQGSSDDEIVLQQLGEVLSRYWKLKIDMAPGSDPSHIRHILKHIEPYACGLSLCGAGAGGFGAIILKPGVSEERLRQAIDEINHQDRFRDNSAKLSVHSVQVDTEGLKVSERTHDHSMTLKTFLV